MNDSSWFKVYRKILNWEWFKDSKTLHVFIYLLSRANVNSGRFQGKTIKRGQIVTSYAKIADATGMSVSSARRAIDNLVSTGEITTRTTNKFSIITIVKYESYQEKNPVREHAKEQAKEQQVKNYKRRTKERKERRAMPTASESEPEKEYIPKWWELELPKQAWGKFDSEEEWYAYAEKHREEILTWDTK